MAPELLVCRITDGSVPASTTLECSVPSDPNPASTPAPYTMTTRLTEGLAHTGDWAISIRVPPYRRCEIK